MPKKTRTRRGRPRARKAPPRPAAKPSTAPPAQPPRSSHDQLALPHLLTVAEVADLLRTTRKAIYNLIHRDELPGVIRLSRRVLVDRAALVDWLDQKLAVSLKARGQQR